MQTISIDPPLLRSLLVLTTVIEARDQYTGGHTWRVSEYARRLGQKFGLSADEVAITHIGSLVHDVGKVGISDGILNKTDKLSDDEYATIKKHPTAGRILVRDHPLSLVVMDIVAEHHERFDGRGYPDGLAGEAISPFARVVAVADAFDAMTSARPYRAGMAAEAAYAVLEQEGGRQFDPVMAKLFVDLGRAGELNHILGHSAEDRPMMNCPECGPILTIPRQAGDGDNIYCARCTGKYVVHGKGNSFEVEWLGVFEPALVPQPDLDTIEAALQQAPKQIKVAAAK